jgi:hypothetical protein
MNRILLLCLTLLLTTGLSSCGAKKRKAEQAAAEQALRAKEAILARLKTLYEATSRPLEDREMELNEIRNQAWQDAEVLSWIAKIEEQHKNERAARERERLREEEELRKAAEEAEKARSIQPQLQRLMTQIANAPDVEFADQLIRQCLQLFESEKTPVLILIYSAQGIKDYDQPTSAIRYLERLKDQKQFTHRIENIQLNTAGKISELELSR